ncbi:hypothetical protein [Aureivirga marina]|uniref:hypothetical protein n=1 Tax=Aureivirga marina TaxID=1182451 RepID=UPI0018CB3031|nr:hypothetical protein [Aureivirga marina]
MNTVKLKLTKQDGSSYGYVGLVNDRFIGGVSEDKAVIFEQEDYKNGNSEAYYYKVKGTHYYMDQSSRDGHIFKDKPFLSVHQSSIYAWKYTDKELHAFIANKDSRQVMGLPRNSRQDHTLPENSLFSNFDGFPLNVDLVQV